MIYRGSSLIRNSSPPKDHHRALGIVLLQGPRETLFLMSEAPLYAGKDTVQTNPYIFRAKRKP